MGRSPVSKRYRIPIWQVVELAPLLFCSAAEASLRRRRKRLAEVGRAREAARNIEDEIDLRPVFVDDETEKKIRRNGIQLRCGTFSV
jgi:hypothetical protein